MGGVVSAGVDNDELVDKLKGADYIKSSKVEKVFRLVDRGYYLTKENQNVAYSDNAWRSGNLHISAPCIYAQVMEGLQINSGMSFLNLGSGTGYLSTMAGLLLGPDGINHGVEIYGDVVDYAKERLSWFYHNSGAIDVSLFCEPQFFQGNALCLSEDIMSYDRVYCGASCPTSHEKYMKNLLKVSGILVMPRNDQLLKITRTEKEVWSTETLLPVSFSSLIMPEKNQPQNYIQLPLITVASLQEMSRNIIRNELRLCLEKDNIELVNAFVHEVPLNATRGQSDFCRVRRIFPDMTFSDPEEESDEETINDDRDTLYDAPRQTASQITAFLDLARSLAMSRRLPDDPNDLTGSNEDIAVGEREEPQFQEELEEDSDIGNRHRITKSVVTEVEQLNEKEVSDSESKKCNETSDNDDTKNKMFEPSNTCEDSAMRTLCKSNNDNDGVKAGMSSVNGVGKDESTNTTKDINNGRGVDEAMEINDKMIEDWVDGQLKDWGCFHETENDVTKTPDRLPMTNISSGSIERDKVTDQSCNEGSSSHEDGQSIRSGSLEGKTSSAVPSGDVVQTPLSCKLKGNCKRNSAKFCSKHVFSNKRENHENVCKKREKFDSGIGEDIAMDVHGQNEDDQLSISSSSSSALSCSVPSSSSTESEDSELSSTSSNGVRLIHVQCNCSDSCQSSNEKRWKVRQAKRKRSHRPMQRMKRETKGNGSEEPILKYSASMNERIKLLPLPTSLKIYLNYYRPL